MVAAAGATMHGSDPSRRSRAEPLARPARRALWASARRSEMSAHTPLQPGMLFPAAVLLAVFVVAAVILIALVVGLAFLPSTTFEIPEPAMPIYEWSDF